MIEELLVVDERDEPVFENGKKLYLPVQPYWNGKYIHRSSHCLLKDRDDWIVQVRPEDHFTSPGKLCFPCGGMVRAGESYYQGAVREFREEMNVEPPSLQELFKIYHEFPNIDKSWYTIFGGKTRYEYLTPGDDVKKLIKISDEELKRNLNSGFLSESLEKAIIKYYKKGIIL